MYWKDRASRKIEQKWPEVLQMMELICNFSPYHTPEELTELRELYRDVALEWYEIGMRDEQKRRREG